MNLIKSTRRNLYVFIKIHLFLCFSNRTNNELLLNYIIFLSDMPEWPSFQPVDFYGFISGIANMTCQANAEPPADFEWTDQNGKDIADGIIMTESHISTLMVITYSP